MTEIEKENLIVNFTDMIYDELLNGTNPMDIDDCYEAGFDRGYKNYKAHEKMIAKRKEEEVRDALKAQIVETIKLLQSIDGVDIISPEQAEDILDTEVLNTLLTLGQELASKIKNNQEKEEINKTVTTKSEAIDDNDDDEARIQKFLRTIK